MEILDFFFVPLKKKIILYFHIAYFNDCLQYRHVRSNYLLLPYLLEK